MSRRVITNPMPGDITLRVTTTQPSWTFHIDPACPAAPAGAGVTVQYAPGSFQNLSLAQARIYRQGTGVFLGRPPAPDSSSLDVVTVGAAPLLFSLDATHPFTWIVCGREGGPDLYRQQLAGYSVQNLLASGSQLPGIAVIRIGGCFTVTLTPQTDPNPPHNVHPIIGVQGVWDSSNPYLSILNPNNLNVDLFVRTIASGNSETDQGPIAFTDSFSAYQVSRPAGSSTWYGFANHGQYATPADYFTAHPYDPSGGHHTQQIPQNA